MMYPIEQYYLLVIIIMIIVFFISWRLWKPIGKGVIHEVNKIKKINEEQIIIDGKEEINNESK